ncbi:hypothetical protein CON24_22005 [Bacillus cereus]|nr:hypothetical protein CON24_22005 [Bacillus cereus]PEG03515.1 hypothetical protein CON54_18165 [Bacillus cereus]PFL56428.1 hypothetical protein COJ33_05725 [Bacillus cereus]PFS26882.1 hypothetical protein COK47_28700 [Bacillus cereus]
MDYISDYQNISAQLQIYQRLLKYIDLPTKTTTVTIYKRVDCMKFSCSLPLFVLSNFLFSLHTFFSTPFKHLI